MILESRPGAWWEKRQILSNLRRISVLTSCVKIVKNKTYLIKKNRYVMCTFGYKRRFALLLFYSFAAVETSCTENLVFGFYFSHSHPG